MTEEDYIDFRCPFCDVAVSFPRTHAGTAQGCPECLESLVVPSAQGEPGQPLPLPIQTPRLVLRRLAAGDWKDLLELMADPELFQFLETPPLDEEGIVQWLESDRSVRLTQTGQFLHLGLELAEGAKLIGHLSLAYRDEAHQQLTLTGLLGRAHHCQGYGTEAVGAVLRFGFQGLGLHRVVASCDARNVAASRLFAKTGFRREGEFLKERKVRDEWISTVWFAILREEWAPPPPAA